MSGRQSRISLNCSLAPPPCTTQNGSHTPNTPEILNTIVNITSEPLFQTYRPPTPPPTSLSQHHFQNSAPVHPSPLLGSVHPSPLLTNLRPLYLIPSQSKNVAPIYTSTLHTSSALAPPPTPLLPSPSASLIPSPTPLLASPSASHLSSPTSILSSASSSSNLSPPVYSESSNGSSYLEAPHHQFLGEYTELVSQQYTLLNTGIEEIHCSAVQMLAGAPNSTGLVGPALQQPQLCGPALHQPQLCGAPVLAVSNGGPVPGVPPVPAGAPPTDSTFLRGQAGQAGTVQKYHSLFIKEGLKMKVRQNLKAEQLEGKMEEDLENDLKQEPEELTAEDEERRRRRRERNKVAATKCRNKKKEKTCLLFSEGEVLENQNLNLKQEISRLEAEKSYLVDILASHQPSCAKRPRRELTNEDDTFRIPAVPPVRGPPRGLSRQDSFLQTLEILENLGDIDEFAQQQQDRQEAEEDDQCSSTYSSSAVQCSSTYSSSQVQPESTYTSCSFSRSKQDYFLVNKPKSLSYSGFRVDNRCIAL